VAGACSLSGTACFSNADCPAACSISGALCFGNNSLCAPVAQNGSCTPQSCVGAVVNTCNGAIGPCAGSCSGVGGGLVCACPTGWIDYGANCCPPGTIQITPGQCTIGNTGFVVEAIPVGSFNEIEYTYPFRVNLPPDPASFELLAPGGSEGAPGVPTGIPWDPSGPIDFESPQPDGMEGPP
jgi:hypothetical protein